MKTTEISNKKLRSKVEELEIGDYLQFNYSPKRLIDLGWSFDDSIDYYLENNEDNELYDRADAEKEFDEDCIVYVRIEKLEDKICTTYELNTVENDMNRISNSSSYDTGDDELTIRDIEKLEDFSEDIYVNMFSKEVKSFNEGKQTWQIIGFAEANIEGLAEGDIREHFEENDYNVIFV